MRIIICIIIRARIIDRATVVVTSGRSAGADMPAECPISSTECNSVFTLRDTRWGWWAPRPSAGRSVDDTEETVARVAQPGHDVALLVQALIDRRGHHGEVH